MLSARDLALTSTSRQQRAINVDRTKEQLPPVLCTMRNKASTKIVNNVDDYCLPRASTLIFTRGYKPKEI